jgi:hypothetical protein
MRAEEEFPNEVVVNTSTSLILSGFLLLLGILVLCWFLWAAGGDPKGTGSRDAFGSTITVADIAKRFTPSWAPGPTIFPQRQTNRASKSPLYRIVWTFLIGWFALTGIFQIMAATIESIEVLREAELLRAAQYACIALVLCGLWIVVFRINSMTDKEIEEQKRKSNVSSAEKDIRHVETKKSEWFWLATLILFSAFLFAVLADAVVQAWTLPSRQYGMMLFVAPLYGLFAGWLLYATSLSLGITIASESYPDGTVEVPENANAMSYQGSLVPVVASIVAVCLAIATPDPLLPFPMALAIGLFAPRDFYNNVSTIVCLLAMVLAGLRIYALRQ